MAVQSDDAELARLLDLQAEDSHIKRLRERRATLPEAARLAEVREQLSELDADLEIARKQSSEIGTEHNRIEGEIGLLEAKIQREEQRMFSGNISNPKELSALQAEVASLKNKRSTLEDGLLEVMLQREQVEDTLARLDGERAASAAEAETLGARVDELHNEIDAELEVHDVRRAELAGTIAEELLRLYDGLREQKGGVGAAALDGGTCLGCHTQLPAREVQRMRAERGLQRCDNCRRILVIP